MTTPISKPANICFTILALAAALIQPSHSSAQYKTLVRGLVLNPLNELAEGYVLVEWTEFVNANGTRVPAGRTAAAIREGTFELALSPNEDAKPVGSVYRVRYNIQVGASVERYREVWLVPSRGRAVSVGEVRVVDLPELEDLHPTTRGLWRKLRPLPGEGALMPWSVDEGKAGGRVVSGSR